MPIRNSPKLSYALTLLAVLTVFTTDPAMAQIVDRVGLKGGLLSSSATDNLDQFDLERRTGWSALLFAERDLLPFLTLVGEGGYAQRGFTETLEERSPSGEVEQIVRATTRLDYLTLPVLVKSSYGLSAMRLYALAGPRLDVLVGREAGVFEYESAPVDQLKSEIADVYTSPILGVTAGVGVSTNHLLPVRLLVEGRWALDVTESFAGVPRDMRNNAVSVMIGIGF